jgi:hypothetical protein
MTFFGLKYSGQFRILAANEGYYQAYDNVKGKYIDEDNLDPDTGYEYS